MNKFFCKKCQQWHWGKRVAGMCLACYSKALRNVGSSNSVMGSAVQEAAALDVDYGGSIDVLTIEEFRSRLFQPPLGNEEGGYSTYDL